MPNIGPPLANSEWVNGPVENLIGIQLRGLTGPITVAGKDYNFPAPMAAMGAGQPDENIAAVLTYIRNSFGNQASPVTAQMVADYKAKNAEILAKVPTPPLNTKDLLDPYGSQETGTATGSTSDAPLATVPSGGIGAPTFGIIICLAFTAVSLLAALRMKASNR